MPQQSENKELKGFEKYLQRKKHSMKKINKATDVQKWIEDCDKDFSKNIENIVDGIVRNGNIKLIRLVGPTCSGKTTAANMLSEGFSALGKRLHTISIDDFYYDTDTLKQMSSNKGHDGIDYDSPDTIDIGELSRFVKEIFSSELSHCPIFDFTTGKREGYREYRCSEDDLFLFEGIQALYPNVSELFCSLGHPTKDIYIAPQSSLNIGEATFDPNELRLMRRLVRDSNFRNTNAEFTFYLWDSVRENEEKNIFPFVKECDYVIDSTMPYEIGILKPYLVKILAEVDKKGAYGREAEKIISKIEKVIPISDKLISERSLYKEFV